MTWSPLRWDLLEQVLNPRPRIGLADIAREVRKAYRNDPMKAESAVGNLYGQVFKKAEEAYAARGHRGRQPWD